MVKRRLSLVRSGTLPRIVHAAVQRSLNGQAGTQIAARLEREMLRAIRSGASSVHGMTRRDLLDELECSNHTLVQARDRARAELEELQRQAVMQRMQLADSHAEMARIVDRGAGKREGLAIDRLAEVFARAQRGELALDALQDEVGDLVRETAQRERRELLEGLCAERDRQIDMLERRIAKLRQSLESSESALREMAARKNVDPGLASIYRTVQGLSDDAPAAEEKRAMLQELFYANLELRGLRGATAIAG